MPDLARRSEGLTETAPRPGSSSSSADEGRFLPGSVLAQRYRIISLLGRGGMGEVYRATDLLLAQPVALKFLPPATVQDEGTLTRFRNEVRIARQVSHPYVCRVYDIGEAEGLVFLSMEYVDGEDFASLLRRIGYLPPDKALEVVRKVCEGLAAAHDKGVIHRDLKPANIMLDSQGQVRIMDFGLAAFAAHAPDVRSGTFAYMAPEQKSGREVTTRSDIYALGILVHEIYTGKRPSDKSSSKVVLDPAVAMVVDRCLAEDPQKRPASPLVVAAALPGGDPLAAALAAGETPSPDVVANAGAAGGMPVRAAAACLLFTLAALVALCLLRSQRDVIGSIPFKDSPEILAGRAREYARAFGYDDPPAHTAMGWQFNGPLLAQLWREKGLEERKAALRTLQPPAATFWYRQHATSMLSYARPEITRDDPPFEPGSIEVLLDPEARLVEFHAAPPARKLYAPAAPPDWTGFFRAAGLDIRHFQPAQPEFTPRAAFDSRQAWKGVYPASPGTEARVEAAAYEGKVTSFHVLSPAATLQQRSIPGRQTLIWALVFVGVLPLWAVVLAWRNVARGRADWNGAIRIAGFCFALVLARGMCITHHLASPLEGMVLMKVLRAASLSFFLIGGLYLAFEPYIRRRAPHCLISWTRLLEGRWRDPAVAADILVAVTSAAALQLVFLMVLNIYPLQPELAASPGEWFSTLVSVFMMFGIGAGLSLLLLFAILRFLLRRTWVAAALLAVITIFTSPTLAPLPARALFAVVGTIVLVRFGLLAMAVLVFASNLLGQSPLTADLSRWYAWQSAGAVLLLAGVAGYAFWANLGGRPLWQDEDAAEPPAAAGATAA